MAKPKKKERSGPATRVHPGLREQGLLYRAGYGEIGWLDWDSDGLWVVTRSAVLLWDAQGELLKRLWTPVHGMARDQSGAFYTAAMQVDCWDKDLVHQRALGGHRGRLEDVSVSPDGALIVSLGEDEQLLVCDAQGQELRRIGVAPGSRKLNVDWLTRKAWTSAEGGAELWDLQSGVRLQQAAVSPRPALAYGEWSVGPEGELNWQGQPREELEEPAVGLVADPGGQWVAVASERELLVFDAATGELLRAWEEFEEWPVSVAVSADQRWVVSGGVDGQLTVRGLGKGEVKQKTPAHSDAITCLAFASQGNILISGSADGTIRSWLWPTLEHLQDMDGHDGPVHQLLVDGSRLFSGGSDGQVLIWDWHSGLELAALTGFEASLEQLQVVQRGEVLIALYDDGSWANWDVSRYGAD